MPAIPGNVTIIKVHYANIMPTYMGLNFDPRAKATVVN